MKTQSINDDFKQDALVREKTLLDCVESLLYGKETRGKILRRLRKDVLNMNQQEFSLLVDVSRRSLTDIENDKSGLNEETINRTFNIFGLKFGLVAMSSKQTEHVIARRVK